MWARRVGALLIIASGCGSSAKVCEGADRDTPECPTPLDAFGCTADDQCAGLACDLPSGLCVTCTATQRDACLDKTPVCGADHACHACVAHAECALSNVCLPDGSCALYNHVAYVAKAGTGTACTKASPCPLLQDAIATGLRYVKIDAAGAANATAPVALGNALVTILADPGATISRDGFGSILDIVGTTNVAIYDLRLSDAPGNAITVNANGGFPKLALVRVTVEGNVGSGVLATGAVALTLTRTRIVNNRGMGISAVGGSLSVVASEISGNLGGGVYASGGSTGVIFTNNVIVHNGTATGASPTVVGGVVISNSMAGSRFEWNTVAFNESSGVNHRGGVQCFSGPMFPAGGNLIYRNGDPDGAGGIKIDATTQLTSTGCTFGTSLALPSDASHLGFAAPLALPYDFHLTTSSPSSVLDAGGACTGTDMDGQFRPAGAACELGADELAP